MPDEVENHIVKKYEIKKRLGKGVRTFFFYLAFGQLVLKE